VTAAAVTTGGDAAGSAADDGAEVTIGMEGAAVFDEDGGSDDIVKIGSKREKGKKGRGHDPPHIYPSKATKKATKRATTKWDDTHSAT
jgi:hypothetical protein